jgi:hypothetical protein
MLFLPTHRRPDCKIKIAKAAAIAKNFQGAASTCVVRLRPESGYSLRGGLELFHV